MHANEPYPSIAADCHISLVGNPAVEALVMAPAREANSDAGEQVLLLPSPLAVWLFVRCDGTRSVAELIGEIRAAFPDVAAAEIATSVENFIADLDARGLLVWRESASESPVAIAGFVAGHPVPMSTAFVVPRIDTFAIEDDIAASLVLSASFQGGNANTGGLTPCNGGAGGVGNTGGGGSCRGGGFGNTNGYLSCQGLSGGLANTTQGLPCIFPQ